MLEVGQQLWYVANNGHSEYVTIEKVGKKWLHIKEGRNLKAAIETSNVYSGNYSMGKIYLSKEEYDAFQEMKSAWLKFRDALYNPPKNLTTEKINRAREILGM